MKKILVSGCTSGIGTEIARGVLERGDFLIMVNRSERKSKSMREIFEKEFPNAHIAEYYADLSIMKQVHILGQRLREAHDHIDILINNAGAYFSTSSTCVQGWEKTFTLNHMGYFALTYELLPLLQASEKGRIVNVASRAHHYGTIDFAQFLSPDRRFAQLAYGSSKLCNILFTRALAGKIADQGITANCLHPGVVRTNIAQDQGGVFALFMKCFSIFLLSPKEGAKTPLFLAYDSSIEGKSGGYYAKCRQIKPSKKASDDQLAQELWNWSEDLYLKTREES